MLKASKKKEKNIISVMFVYWISIIIWQTIRPVGNRSLIDTAMKIALFFPLLSYGWKHEKMTQNTVTFSYFLVFFITQMITLITDSGEVGLSQLITIVFMMMEVVIFLIFLFRETCRLSMIEKFCSSLVIVAIVMSFYNMIFNFDTFIYTFSGGGGSYGHECASFLYSNHEFALYLSVSILSLFWSFFRKKTSVLKFAVILTILALNLLSTYSRTAILGLIIALSILIFFYDKKIFIYFLIIGIIALIVILNNEFLYKLVFKQVLKGTFENEGVLDEERAGMYVHEMNAFLNGTWFQKIFGQGYAGASKYGGHDAYLIVLLTGGVCMMAFFLFIIAFGFYHAYQVLRRDKLLGAFLIGFIVFALLYMFAQTPILFYSSMDSFFVTMIAVMIPFYTSNGIRWETNFYEGTSN